MANEFFALMGRMRYITRWGLMRNTFSENIQEHSHQVAVLAHALALIRRDMLKELAFTNQFRAPLPRKEETMQTMPQKITAL